MYNSRYSIKGEPREGNTIDCIDKISHQKKYRSIDNYLNLTFSFDSPFLVTHYSLTNAVPDGSNSFPKSWQLFGRDERGLLHMIDERNDQNFANGRSQVTKTFSTKARKVYKEFVWQQKESNFGFPYAMLKHFDFFGVLCGKTGKCSTPLFNGTCRNKKVSSFSIIHSLLVLFLK